jgi:hypothetical protein
MASEITLVFIDLYHNESTLVLIYSTVFPPPPPHHTSHLMTDPPKPHTLDIVLSSCASHTPNQSVSLLLTSCAVCVA